MKLLTNPSMVIIAQCITYNRLYTLTLSNVIYQSHLNQRRKNEENRLLYSYNYQANVLVLAGFSLDSLIAPSWLFFFFSRDSKFTQTAYSDQVHPKRGTDSTWAFRRKLRDFSPSLYFGKLLQQQLCNFHGSSSCETELV